MEMFQGAEEELLRRSSHKRRLFASPNSEKVWISGLFRGPRQLAAELL
jgi:hypothetical protein